MRRREFITLLGGSALGWSIAARAQQPDQLRRIGVLSNSFANSCTRLTLPAATSMSTIAGASLAAETDVEFAGRGHRISETARRVGVDQRSVLVGITTPATAALQAETKTIPIVFAMVSDPIGSGFVASFPKPAVAGTDAQDRTVRVAGRHALQSTDRTLRSILFGYLPIRCRPRQLTPAKQARWEVSDGYLINLHLWKSRGSNSRARSYEAISGSPCSGRGSWRATTRPPPSRKVINRSGSWATNAW